MFGRGLVCLCFVCVAWMTGGLDRGEGPHRRGEGGWGKALCLRGINGRHAAR